jgi:hypothetical protein
MRDISVDITEPKKQVDLFEQIGRISDVGKTAGHADSPHLHHVQVHNGTARKMRLRGLGNVGLSSNKLTPDFASGRRRVEGALRPRGPATAILRVAVRSGPDADWSKRARLRFKVAAKEQAFAPCDDIECATPGASPSGFAIATSYDGETLEAGRYSIRYRALDADGNATRWAFDHSLVIG